MSKRITQTNEIQSGNNSGVVFSGNEKASYSNEYPLNTFSAKDLMPRHAIELLINADVPPSSTLMPWNPLVATDEDNYVTYPIDGIEYLFRSNIDGNMSEPSINIGTPAWTNLNITDLPDFWDISTDYSLGEYVRLTSGGVQHTYRSLENGNIGNSPTTGVSNEYWEYEGVTRGFFPNDAPYNLNDIVLNVAGDGFVYKSNFANNNYAIDDIVGGNWAVIGAPAGGSASESTSGTLLDSDSPLVINWSTDLVPGDEEGRTYLEKHGPLEKVSIQTAMPDPSNEGSVSFFPNWRFDEATKNILTIDNQGQKLYYVIGFGADGSSGGGSVGPQGPQGPQGIQGPQGPPGSDATVPDANGSTKGKIQLAGDLGGTAASPTVPGLSVKANIAASQVTLTALTFTSDSVSGTTSSPITGSITGITTGAQLGVTVLVIHNHSVAPTFDSKFKKLSGSGDYVTGQLNYIYCQYIDATNILYSINQTA